MSKPTKLFTKIPHPWLISRENEFPTILKGKGFGLSLLMERKWSKRDPKDLAIFTHYSLNIDFNQMERNANPKDLRKGKFDGDGYYRIFYLEIFCENWKISE